MIEDFLSHKAKVCAPNMDSIAAIPNKKDTLYIYLQQLNDRVVQDSFLSKSMMHIAGMMYEFSYHDNILVLVGGDTQFRLGSRLMAFFLLHSGYIHLCDKGIHPMIKEVRAREFMGGVIGQMGGEAYARLFEKYKIPDIRAEGQVELPNWNQVVASRDDMAEIFKLKKGSYETKYLSKIFWTSVIFKIIDSRYPGNAEYIKGRFLGKIAEQGWI